MKRIELKIIVSVMLFTIFIVLLQRYQLSESIIQQFKESKQDRNQLLINTITPVVGLDISLGLENAYGVYLDNIAFNNSDLDAIILVDFKQKELYHYRKDIDAKLSTLSFNYSTKDIFDSLTGEKLASIELYFSNEDYEKIVKKNTDITINIFFVSFILLSLFLFLIKREFRHLTKLTSNVLKYDPKKNNFPLEEMKGKDEVSLIHKAIVSMVEKINIYSKQLDDINANLERKVIQRTKELEIQKSRAEELVNVKANFLANMSHEIRTPMNAIIGITHLMKKTNLTEKQKNYLKKIHKVSHNLLIIINDILDFSKMEAGKLQIEQIHFDIHDIIESLLYIFEDRAKEKELTFTVEKFCGYSVLYGDSFRIEQVLINLISNAIKFTNSGSVTLAIECLASDKMRFSVKDSGIGIKKKQLKYLFKAFMQADDSTTREYGGTGLGLSISKQIIQQMDGKIWVESKEGEGSEFIFELYLPHTDSTDVPIEKKLYKDNLRDLYKDSLSFETSKVKTSAENIEVLFLQLLEASKSKLPKICEPILEELEKFKLSIENELKFKKIQMLFKHYKFKEIITLLEQS